MGEVTRVTPVPLSTFYRVARAYTSIWEVLSLLSPLRDINIISGSELDEPIIPPLPSP